MNRIQLIQSLIDSNSYKSYLEIGVAGGECINVIRCAVKVGVDPDRNSRATVFETSDDFFAKNNMKFDICFSDGLHHADQSERDILNMLKCLNYGGIIVCHDMLPKTKAMQEVPRVGNTEWTGDVWKSFVKLRTERPDLVMFVVDTDYGCGIIKKGCQETISIDVPLTYENFVKYRDVWMNVISIEEFKSNI